MRKSLTYFAAVVCIAVCALLFGACSDAEKGGGGGDSPKPTAITVTFDSHGGTAFEPIKYTGVAITLPTPERNGYDFSGWYVASDASGAKVTSPYTPTADITLYAGWTEKQTPTPPDPPPPDDPDAHKPVISGTYDYDLTAGGDLTVDVDVKGGQITSVKFDGREIAADGYAFAGGKLVIDKLWLMGAEIGDVALEITTDKGEARTTVSVTDPATAPRFAYEKYVYDLAIGGVLDMKLDATDAPAYLKIGAEYAHSDEFAYTDGALTVSFDKIADIGVGTYNVTAVTATGSASAVLIVINTVKTSFTSDTVREYDYGKTKELVFDADFDDVTVSSLKHRGRSAASAVVVDPEAYSYADGKFKVNDKILDKIYGETEFTVTLSNSDRYTFTVKSNVLFYTDYDDTTINDGALYINSTPEIVETPDGNVLRFMGVGKACPSYTYSIRNTRLENTNWYGVEIPAGKYATVDFDYSLHGETGENNYVFTYIDGSGTVECSLPLGENKHVRYTLPTDNLHVICVNTLTHDGTSYMDIDNFRVTLVDSVPQGGTLPEYNITTGGNFVLPFDDQGYAISDVNIDGVSTEYTYAGGKIVFAQNVMPVEVKAHTLTVETVAFTATYTFNTTSNDYKITLDKTVFAYRYGIDGNIVVTGTFGEKVAVSSLMRKGKHDETPVIVDTSMYAFDTATGLTLKKDLLDSLYGATAFTIAACGAEYTFTVKSDVLFYTDYDVTTINDSALYIFSTPEIVETAGGNVLRFMGAGKPCPSYTYAIRNSRLQNTDWYGVEMPTGKYVTIDFDYSVCGITGENDYVFTYIDGSGTVERSLPLGERHARFTLPTDNLNVICVNTLKHDGASYMDIDNFRVTLIGSVPQGGALPEYNNTTGGDLSISFDCAYAVTDVKIDGASTAFTYENKAVIISKSDLPEEIGAHSITVDTKAFTVAYTINIVTDDYKVTLDKTEFDYSYGIDESIVVGGSFGKKVTVASLTRKSKHDETPITVDASMYAFDTATGLTLKKDLLDKLYGSTALTMTSSDAEYTFTVNSNVLFYTDYDATTINDGALYVNSNGAYEIAQTESGRVLRFMGAGKPSSSYIYQIRNSRLENSMWYGMEIPAGKYVTVDFDYSAHDISGSNDYCFTYIDGGNNTGLNLSLGNGEVKHARFTLQTDNLHVICVNNGTHDGTSYMDIDNFRVTLIDSAVQGGALPEYNNTTGGDMSIPFDSAYAVTDVKIDGVSTAFTYENKFVTISKSDLPEDIGRHDIVVETAVFDAVYTVNIVTDDYKVTLDKTAFDYTYGDGDIAVTGSFGRKVTVTSLTRSGRHYETPAEVSADMYTFDPANGLVIKAALADRLFGTTTFKMTASGAEYTFTVKSNVLFYTDYDVTTINDGALCVNSNGAYEIVQTESGRVLRFMGAGKPYPSYVFQIRNSLRENSGWYGMEIPAGKYITVDFDYSIHNITGENKYMFTNIQNGAGAEQLIEPGNGEVKHARYVLPTDVLNVFCVNTVSPHDGTSYMDIDNFRVTLLDSAPQEVRALNAAGTIAMRAGEGYGEYDVMGGKKVFDFSDESQKSEFDFYSVTGNYPFISEGKLVTLPYAKEQKIIYRHDFSGDMAVSVDVMPISGNFMIDGGIYLNAYGADNGTDKIKGLCLNVEKASGENSYLLKLHKFSFGYLGEEKAVRLDYNGIGVHIDAVIKSGTLYAFADGVLAFTYAISDYSGGKAGLRSFYAAQKFDNFTVVSSDFDVDASVLEKLKTDFASLDGDKYFAEGYNSLKAAIDGLIADPASQTYIDRNVKALSELFDALEEKHTKAELDALAAQCAEIPEESFTTNNSYRSMRSLIERAVAADENEISELYMYMTFLKDNAVEVKA